MVVDGSVIVVLQNLQIKIYFFGGMGMFICHISHTNAR